MSVQVYSRPNTAIPDSEKDEAYHKAWALAIVNGSLTITRANQFRLWAELYRFYSKGSDGSLTNFLQETSEGTKLPAYWISTQSIQTKIDLLAGELEQRGYEIHATAINKEAISRKLEEKERLRVERKLRNDPDVQQAQQIAGIPLFKEEYIPQSDRELDEYIDLGFKDKAELIMTGALRWTALTENWDEHRKKAWMDALITGYAIFTEEVVRNKPTPRRVDPMCFITDAEATDDMHTDATYFGEVHDMPLSQAAEEYGLTLAQLREVQGHYETYLGEGVVAPGMEGLASSPGNSFRWFRNSDTPRVMVVKTVWSDFMDLNYKEESNEKGDFLQFTDKPDKKTKSKRIKVWRQATIIGGTIIKNWGLYPNQPKDLDTLERSDPPYQVWGVNKYQGEVVSKTEQLAGLQLLKDIMLYNLQLEISSAPGRILQYDLAMKPEGMTNDQIKSYIRSERIAYVNSKEYQLTTGAHDMVKAIDLTATQSLNNTLQVIQYIDHEMAINSGVSPERQGIVQGASQGLGVTQSALFQSNLITTPYFNSFERLCSRALTHLAKQIKIVWPEHAELYAPIIGDVGVDFLREHIDLDLDSFSVVVRSLPPMLTNRQTLDGLVMQAAASDPSLLPDALAVVMEPDLKQAVRKLQRKFAFRKYLETQQAQAQQERDTQLQQQLAEADAQRAAQERDNALALQGLKNEGNLAKTLATSKTKLAEQKIKALSG